ncbi:MAG: hypothetical protein QOH60_2172 [Mycobacterium sp.]|nr:hypothetical protein [Mycobacterium sp.]
MGEADSFCIELNAESHHNRPPASAGTQKESIMSSLFYIIAIFTVIASPMVVPVTVTIVGAVRDFRERLAARPATAGTRAVRPVFAGAVPAAA